MRRNVVIFAVTVVVLVAACGGGSSQDELEQRVAELEDELARVADVTTMPESTTAVTPLTTMAPTTTGPQLTSTTFRPTATATPTPPATEELFFDERGFGPIEAGMSLRTVEAVAGTEAIIDSNDFEVFGGSCYYAALDDSRFADLSLLIVSPDDRPVDDPLDGIVGSVSTFTPGATTKSGVGVGSTEADVFAAYPDQITVSPHEYQQAGHYLDVAEHAADGSVFYLRFATDGVIVTSISSGSDAARYVEGCA